MVANVLCLLGDSPNIGEGASVVRARDNGCLGGSQRGYGSGSGSSALDDRKGSACMAFCGRECRLRGRREAERVGFDVQHWIVETGQGGERAGMFLSASGFEGEKERESTEAGGSQE
ncbi:hypothetical protein MPH_04544 [Macrophomina phaseolina MS6]|uniref:Uncharacterized protein n=1 Tax=Macrophomina phaseolina (strain MS6) TaxID=1126212 RepID=K2SN04_MACPH|nr:hypothetical protein MPH_04544 [Macrophomina phaseolina MS6]